jgi:RNA-directed DNA polymerase
MAERKSEQTAGDRTQNRGTPSNGLQRLREAAGKDKRQRMSSLMHHLTVALLRQCFYELRKDAAAGVDEVTWREYQTGLEGRLEDLHDRVQSGRYRALPSKRAYTLKDDGRKRPIGIPALEDKIAQAAAVQVMNQIWEGEFLGFSYGFRPERSQHNALDALWMGIMRRRVNWIVDADIRSFFDSLNHDWMNRFVEHRISDRRFLRLIRKWLRAGVSEDGQWSRSTVGTPQGAVISPLLANIFLHYVLDQWVQKWRQAPGRGQVIIVRYADDFVVGFEKEQAARSFLKDLAERLAKFSLELHPDKTRLLEFGRYAARKRGRTGQGKPETFDFLGFTHICSQIRKTGEFTVRRHPIRKRLRKKLKEIGREMRKRRHEPVAVMGRWLGSVVRGVFNYYAVPGTCEILTSFRRAACRHWLQTLRRRSQRGRTLTWEKLEHHIAQWIPEVRVLHPYPNQRLRLT